MNSRLPTFCHFSEVHILEIDSASSMAGAHASDDVILTVRSRGRDVMNKSLVLILKVGRGGVPWRVTFKGLVGSVLLVVSLLHQL